MEESEGPALLARLIRAWRAAYPNKATGGLNALSGFGFQFDLALRQMLHDWQRLESAERERPATFVEQLSDLVTARMGEPVIVHQVKLTQSARSIRSGLDDLFSVFRVAENEGLDRSGAFRFVLAYSSGDPDAAQTIVEAWAAEDPGPRSRFAASVEIHVQEDPGGEVIDLLANVFKAEEPTRLHDQWIGELFAAAGYPAVEEAPAELRATARSIWRQLESLDRASRRRGGLYLLSVNDRSPETASRGGVLTGQQPTIDHLRRGFFAQRPAVTARLRSRFLSWLEERDTFDGSPAVPVFWIGGRSGSGKSIALIQLLAALRGEGWNPILWLADKSRLLPEAARWTRDSSDLQSPPLIGLDDPYAPALSRTESWDSFLAELNDDAQADGAAGKLPTLVCCGPTEQAEMLERDFPDALDLEIVELEREQLEDLEQLRAWYEERTGTSAPSELDQNMLLVQLFFEWRTGEPLRSFAERFRKRIEIADDGGEMLPLLAEVLAVNRLYVGFPVSEAERRLTDKEADLLDRLQREEHIRISGDGVRSGLWLAHPHLANGIYEAWFPAETSQRERQGHFREAALASLRADAATAERVAPIRAVALGLTTSVAAIRDRVDAGVVDVLPAVYDEALEMHEGRPPIEELALWVEVQMSTGEEFEPNPVDEALPLMTPQACRLPATGRLCETLLSSFDHLAERQQEDLINIVTYLLERVPGWPSWSRVASAALNARPSERLSRLVATRIQSSGRLDSVGGALVSSIESSSRTAPTLRAQALRLLQDQPGKRNWGRTWSALWKQGPDDGLRRMGLEYLESHPRDPAWPYVWSALAETPTAMLDELSPVEEEVKRRLPELGLQWLGEEKTHNGWTRIWIALWDQDPSGHLETLGRRWLNDVGTTSQFSLVWSRLWDGGCRDPAMRDLGINALNRIDFDKSAWSFVFLALYKEEPTSELRAMGLRWAQLASPNGGGWGYVLPALWRIASKEGDRDLLDELERAALNFLQKASPEHGGWSYVFARLHAREAVEDLRDLGLRWLGEVSPRHVGWARTWRRLLNPKAPGTKEEAEACERHLALGEEWLLGAPKDEPGWGFVFLALWPRRPSRRLRREARVWLKSGREHPAWDLVWRALWLGTERHGDRIELRRQALNWLRLQHGNKAWPMVWRSLWDEEPAADLAQAAAMWMAAAGRRHPRRSYVTDRIDPEDGSWIPRGESWIATVFALVRRLSANPTDIVLCESMEILLDGVPDGEYQRPLAWKELWEQVWRRVRRKDLREAALKWLELPLPPGPNGRSYVWKALWRDESSSRLYRIGCDYLASAPHRRSLWAPMWFELWDFEPSEELRALGEAGLQSNSFDDRYAKAIRERLQQRDQAAVQIPSGYPGEQPAAIKTSFD